MQKKYIVRLSSEELQKLESIVKKLQGGAQKFRRAQILLKADADGPCWTDAKIADAFNCRTKTVENVRKGLVTEGFDIVLNGKKRATPPVPKKLDGKQEAEVIALRPGDAPDGFAGWSLSLLAGKIVELGITDSICRETVRQTLKKTG